MHETAAALSQMMSELHIKHGAVNCALPAQSVFARFVTLPSLEHEKLEKVIAFEAQQNVPFPIDDVVWDYQVVGGGLDEQIQVILVAIKHDLLDGVNGAVEETGLQTSTIDTAPMALYNAFRYNYPNVNDCSLLVDIGARPPVPQTRSTIHRRAQRNAFRRCNARRQSRLFARWNQSLRHNPSSIRVS